MSWLDKKLGAKKHSSVAIIGLSSFGSYLCKYLSEYGSELLALDIDEEKVEKVKSFVKQGIIADATNKEVLEGLELNEFDHVVVSVGSAIDASILITLYLRELGVRSIVAKAESEDHAKILNMLGASEIVFPEKDMAQRFSHMLVHQGYLDYFYLGDEYSIVEIAPPNEWLGKTLKELDIRKNYHIQVIMIKEIIPDRVTIIPSGDHVIKDSDVLVLIGKEEDLQKIRIE